MLIEQKLALCEFCQRPFAVQYSFRADRIPRASVELVTARDVPCPHERCGHRNPLLMLLHVHDIEVRAIPGLAPSEWRFRPNTLRLLREAWRAPRGSEG
jgi:hypothetical protein